MGTAVGILIAVGESQFAQTAEAGRSICRCPGVHADLVGMVNSLCMRQCGQSLAGLVHCSQLATLCNGDLAVHRSNGSRNADSRDRIVRKNYEEGL